MGAVMARGGTGFINPGTYLDANREEGRRMASEVAAGTAQQGDAARAALQRLQAGEMAPEGLQRQAQDVSARARLASPAGGGLASVLQQDYGRGGNPYTSGMAGWDAFLAGTAGGGTLAQSGNQYGGLAREVDAHNRAAAAYKAPTAGGPASPPLPAPPPSYGGRQRIPVPRGYNPSTYLPEVGEMGTRARRQPRSYEGGIPSARRGFR